MSQFNLDNVSTEQLVLLKAQITETINARKKQQSILARVNRAHLKTEPNVVISDSEASEFNRSGLYSLPGYYARKHLGQLRYFDDLIHQDWSSVYHGGDPSESYYVYAHVDPSRGVFSAQKSCGGSYGGQPFYIGKGTGDRAYNFKRNQGHGETLNRLTRQGISKEKIVKIVFDKLSEAKAFELEAKLIYFFGTIYAKDKKKHGLLVNLDMPKTPDFVGVMREYSRK